MENNRTFGDSPYRSHQLELAATSLRIDENVLRKAGVHSYSVEIKTGTKGKWNVVYSRKADLHPLNE